MVKNLPLTIVILAASLLWTLPVLAVQITAPKGYTVETSPGIGNNSATATPAVPSSSSGASAPYQPSYIIVPQITANCLGGSIGICNKNVPVPTAVLGTTLTLSTPSPYVAQPFIVQCINLNGVIGYQIIDSSAVTCTLQSCQPSPIDVCGASVEVPATIPLGSTVKVQIPTSYLTDTTSTNLSVTAACVGNGGPDPAYQVTDASNVSCNLFPCPESNIRLCDTEIPLHGGTPLGGVLHLTMPKPFVGDPFTVQCVGSAAHPPSYQLTDHDSVSCALAPAAQ